MTNPDDKLLEELELERSRRIAAEKKAEQNGRLCTPGVGCVLAIAITAWLLAVPVACAMGWVPAPW